MSAQLRTARRTRALFQSLSNDFLLREQFVTDPAGILSEYIDGTPMPPETATAANQLLYAVVSNPAMLKWLQQQTNAADARRGNADGRSFAASFAAAASRHSDEALIASLIRCGASESGMVEPALDLMKAAVMLAGGQQRLPGGTEFTPGTATEFTPGTETEFTPGTETEFTPATGTEVSPVEGTEVSPGTGTEFTPATGTEVSPGTATEMTPGTGTQVSPASRAPQAKSAPRTAGRPTRGEFEVALRSLMAYANELRAVGALTETGLE